MPNAPKTHLQRQRASGMLPPSRRRESSCKRGYGRSWRKARDLFLRQHPLCKLCMEDGRREPATCVDHVAAHKGDMAVFWDSSKWQALCTPCHSGKTAREDGGFGRMTTFEDCVPG